MILHGTIVNGRVVLDEPLPLPEGARVRVSIEPEEQTPRSLKELLEKFAGCMTDLPSDMARNHDHYIHGTPKR
jgi:predicted DNA-binding antitoxin AbrB/MazE fold protein